jgi:lipopolysaccharide/colanic/teichoic acid biosynthesis glycosyltransferase
MNDIRQFDSKNVAGYFSSSIVLNRMVNLSLSVFFLILLAPVSVLLIPAVFIVNGWPVIYAGTRLGKNKKAFIMYKFRTLPKDFEKQYDGKLVSYQHGYQLPRFCRFMRDTRLDEIPQLINIFKGDMDFVGPRPVRPVIYQTVCRSIIGYDKRFSVKPGLIGYSQLFTPHSTPKRIRSFIDNRATRNSKNFLCDTLIILLAGFGVILKTTQLLYRFFMIFFQDKILKKFDNKRTLDRIKQKFGTVYFCTLKGQFNYFCLEFESNTGVLKDINEEYFRVDTHLPLNIERAMFKAEALVNTKLFQKHAKSFYGYGTIFRMYENPGKELKYTYILKYEPASDLNRYFVDQYFLKKSLMRYVI